VNQTVTLQFPFHQARLEELLTSISKTEVQSVISLQFTVSDRLTLQKQLSINATNDTRL